MTASVRGTSDLWLWWLGEEKIGLRGTHKFVCHLPYMCRLFKKNTVVYRSVACGNLPFG